VVVGALKSDFGPYLTPSGQLIWVFEERVREAAKPVVPSLLEEELQVSREPRFFERIKSMFSMH
jgi:hypothetical protein